MRILVTGARGKVGAAAVTTLHAAGHEATACDRVPPVFEAPEPGVPHDVQAALRMPATPTRSVRGHEAVVHAAALPEPTRDPPHVVFANNLLATFNPQEA